MPYHGVTSHLAPFLPYVEKANSSDLRRAWRMPDKLSRPIDLATLQAWLRTCDASHGDHCRANLNPIDTPDDHFPTWLVDVRKRCIVRVTTSPQIYVALSYVWGKAECISLTTSTTPQLLTEGSLNSTTLPRTLRDAMDLVSTLGLPFLWIDRLCIVQDDQAEKHAQIKAMGSIYAQAYFTLIAAQSHDASGPLSSRPVQFVSRAVPRRLFTTIARWTLSKLPNPSSPESLANSPWRGPKTDREVMHIMSIDLLRTTWFSRGWTFQEFLFSPRKVVFHNNTLNWECHCASYHETQPVPLSPSTASTPCPRPPGTDIDAYPNFHRYARLAALFTPRHLSFPEDALDAFAGTAAAFARVYPGGLVTGLPAMVFDAALLWQPYHPLRRRRAVLVEEGEAVLPSWSWVSWQGEVHSETWASGWDYLGRFGGVEEGNTGRWVTASTVEWSHSRTVGGERAPVRVVADEFRRRDWGEVLPAGWKEVLDEKGHGGYFVYDTLPGCEFRYPIPLSTGRGHAFRSRYLHCRTRHAHFRVSPKPFRSFAGRCAVVALEGPDGCFAGCLRLNDLEQDVRGSIGAEERYHLIELSSGSVGLGNRADDLPDHPLADVFDEWSLPGWVRKDGLYEFYNVMWVEWRDGVAFRLAVGRVEKQSWEETAVEEMDVTIG
ncbi:heterokaryon incompatibility protein-domain-containing protein [Cercophora scortea]|uniref:Heterokaryon incompatibility protein-domain-containing protein n=1 Tax=Cercophora scortea TaxID=314031 RepID=A0AAE0I6V0_9PEZI|nr:heterokaryon incompatibility protein-domain-containing protein [Cercophora scortea]